jgi:hypothetical protein
VAKAVLHYDPTAIHVVGQVVAKCNRVEEWEIAVRHHDLVLLELSESGSAYLCIEEVDRDHIGFGLDLRLKLSWRSRIGIDDEHMKASRRAGGRR